jgi:uncharacterized protein
VGCGRTAPKDELLRIALSGRTAVLDPPARLPGRGAYLCVAEAEGDVPAGACLEQAIKRRAFARALRAPVSLEDKLVESVGR